MCARAEGGVSGGRRDGLPAAELHSAVGKSRVYKVPAREENAGHLNVNEWAGGPPLLGTRALGGPQCNWVPGPLDPLY